MSWGFFVSFLFVVRRYLLLVIRSKFWVLGSALNRNTQNTEHRTQNLELRT
jgi:hypothetical protein